MRRRVHRGNAQELLPRLGFPLTGNRRTTAVWGDRHTSGRGWVIRRRAWPIRVRMTTWICAIATLVCLVMSAIVVVGLRGQVADYRQEKVTQAALKVVYLIKKNRLPA